MFNMPKKGHPMTKYSKEEIKRLVEFLGDEIYNAINCLPIALTTERRIGRIAIFTEIKRLLIEYQKLLEERGDGK